MKTNVFDKSGWLTVVLFGVVLIAAAVAAVPSFFGHTSEEIKMEIGTYLKDCGQYPSYNGSNENAVTCTMYCPHSTSVNVVYSVISGNCLSADGTAWKMFGAVTDSSTGDVGWTCVDLSHEFSLDPYDYTATVTCLKSGAP